MTDADPPAPAHLTWQGPALLPPDLIERLVGPGARYEMRVDDVVGRRLPVFVNRAPNLRALLDRAAEAHGDDDYLVGPDRRWTFAEVARDVDAYARLLVERYGIGPGDRVAIVSANSPEYALLMWAVVTVGAVVASLNGWWTGPELTYGIELTEPTLICGDERRLERIPPEAIPEGVPVVLVSDLATQAAELDGAAFDRPTVDEDAPAVILFTSGTTGQPKGATLSHRNIINFGEVAGLSSEIGRAMAPAGAPVEQTATILASPMFHVSGMLPILMSGPALGTKLVLAPPGRWDETEHLRLTEEHRISSWSGVPTQHWRLIRHPDLDRFDLSSLRSIGGGGAPFAPELARVLVEKLPGISLGNGYGMSETVGLGTITGGPLMAAIPESVGPAQAGTELQIRDAGGSVVLEGEVGEIHLRSASVFLGYWNDEAATAAAVDAEGWYRTGDFGHVAGGMLYLASRGHDLILRGGENIYPIEIEHRLVAHPDIDDAAVIGVDHEVLGQEVKAFVVVRAGTSLTAADVQRWAAEALAAFKVPAHVEFRAALPYNDTGKVLKRELD